MEIFTRELKKNINTDEIIVEAGLSSIEIDTPEFYISASLNTVTNHFECSVYLGENEVVLKESQKDMICNLLAKAENTDNEFSYDNQFHALSLIF